jgi:DNA-binding GntR family transcriptional regulator
MAVEIDAVRPIGALHQPLDVVVRDELRRRIVSGQLAPGARLIETAIANDLGVSRGPVRSAIRQLELEGFVVLSPRRGASVATVSVAEALECYEVRSAVEGLAATRAAMRRSDVDIERMRAVLRAGQASLDEGRWEELSQLNNDFHVALAMASGNNELVWLMRQYSKRIAWMFSRSAQRRGAQAWREHAAIVQAVADRDEIAAATLATEHITASREQFVLSTPVAADPSTPAATAPGPRTP